MAPSADPSRWTRPAKGSIRILVKLFTRQLLVRCTGGDGDRRGKARGLAKTAGEGVKGILAAAAPVLNAGRSRSPASSRARAEARELCIT